MSFQALGAIAKFKRANTKKKNPLIRHKAPSTHTMSRKISSNTFQVNINFRFLDTMILRKTFIFQCCSNFTLTDLKSQQQMS